MEIREKWQTRSVMSDLKTRAEPDAPKVIDGYFAVFNRETELFAGAYEQIAPGSFAESLKGDVRALINHDHRLVLGRTTAGTLTLREDEKGLYGSIVINENDSEAVNLYERVKRGDVSQCSFGFEIVKEETEIRENGEIKWTIREVNLFEVSVCTFPAYEETGVQARSKEADSLRDKRFEAKKIKIKERLKNGIKSIDVE